MVCMNGPMALKNSKWIFEQELLKHKLDKRDVITSETYSGIFGMLTIKKNNVLILIDSKEKVGQI